MSCGSGYNLAIVKISIDTGEVALLNPVGSTSPSYNLMCQCDGILIAVRSSLTTKPELVMKRVDDKNWILLREELQPKVDPVVAEILDKLEQIEMPFQPHSYPQGKPDNVVDCEAIFIRRKDVAGLTFDST